MELYVGVFPKGTSESDVVAGIKSAMAKYGVGNIVVKTNAKGFPYAFVEIADDKADSAKKNVRKIGSWNVTVDFSKRAKGSGGGSSTGPKGPRKVTLVCNGCGWKQSVMEAVKDKFTHCPNCTQPYASPTAASGPSKGFVEKTCPHCDRIFHVEESKADDDLICPYCRQGESGWENPAIATPVGVRCKHRTCKQVHILDAADIDDLCFCSRCGHEIYDGSCACEHDAYANVDCPHCQTTLEIEIHQGTVEATYRPPTMHRLCAKCGELMPADFDIDVCESCGYDNDVVFGKWVKAGCPTCRNYGEIDKVLASNRSSVPIELFGRVYQVNNLVYLFCRTGNLHPDPDGGWLGVSKVDGVFRGDREKAEEFFHTYFEGYVLPKRYAKVDRSDAWEYLPWIPKDDEVVHLLVSHHSCAWKGCAPDARLTLITAFEEKTWGKASQMVKDSRPYLETGLRIGGGIIGLLWSFLGQLFGASLDILKAKAAEAKAKQKKSKPKGKDGGKGGQGSKGKDENRDDKGE